MVLCPVLGLSLGGLLLSVAAADIGRQLQGTGTQLVDTLFWYDGGSVSLPRAPFVLPNGTAAIDPGIHWVPSYLLPVGNGRLLTLGYFDNCAGALIASVSCHGGIRGDVLIGNGSGWLNITVNPGIAKTDFEAFYFSRSFENGRSCEAACIVGGSQLVNGTLVASADVLCSGVDTSPGSDPANPYLGQEWQAGAPVPEPLLGATFVAANGSLLLVGGWRPTNRFDVLTAVLAPGSCDVTAWAEETIPSWPGRRYPLATYAASRGTLYMGGGVARLADDSSASMDDLWQFADLTNLTKRTLLAQELPVVPLTSQYAMWAATLHPDYTFSATGGLANSSTSEPLPDVLFIVSGVQWYVSLDGDVSPWVQTADWSYPFLSSGYGGTGAADCMVAYAGPSFPQFIGMSSTTRELWSLDTISCSDPCNANGPGAGTWTSGCRSTPWDAPCRNCTVCGAGLEYVKSPDTDSCGSTATHPLGFVDTICSTCASCPDGYYVSIPCGGENPNVCALLPSKLLMPISDTIQLALAGACGAVTLVILGVVACQAVKEWRVVSSHPSRSGGIAASMLWWYEANKKNAATAAAAAAAAERGAKPAPRRRRGCCGSLPMADDGPVAVGPGQRVVGGVAAALGLCCCLGSCGATRKGAAAAPSSASGEGGGGSGGATAPTPSPPAAPAVAPLTQRIHIQCLWLAAVTATAFNAASSLAPLMTTAVSLLLVVPIGLMFTFGWGSEVYLPSPAAADSFRLKGTSLVGEGQALLVVFALSPLLTGLVAWRMWLGLGKRAREARLAFSHHVLHYPRRDLLRAATALALWHPSLFLMLRGLGLSVPGPVARQLSFLSLLSGLTFNLPVAALMATTVLSSAIPSSRWATLPALVLILELFHVGEALYHMTRLQSAARSAAYEEILGRMLPAVTAAAASIVRDQAHAQAAGGGGAPRTRGSAGGRRTRGGGGGSGSASALGNAASGPPLVRDNPMYAPSSRSSRRGGQTPGGSSAPASPPYVPNWATQGVGASSPGSDSPLDGPPNGAPPGPSSRRSRRIRVVAGSPAAAAASSGEEGGGPSDLGGVSDLGVASEVEQSPDAQLTSSSSGEEEDSASAAAPGGAPAPRAVFAPRRARGEERSVAAAAGDNDNAEAGVGAPAPPPHPAAARHSAAHTTVLYHHQHRHHHHQPGGEGEGDHRGHHPAPQLLSLGAGAPAASTHPSQRFSATGPPAQPVGPEGPATHHQQPTVTFYHSPTAAALQQQQRGSGRGLGSTGGSSAAHSSAPTPRFSSGASTPLVMGGEERLPPGPQGHWDGPAGAAPRGGGGTSGGTANRSSERLLSHRWHHHSPEGPAPAVLLFSELHQGGGGGGPLPLPAADHNWLLIAGHSTEADGAVGGDSSGSDSAPPAEAHLPHGAGRVVFHDLQPPDPQQQQWGLQPPDPQQQQWGAFHGHPFPQYQQQQHYGGYHPAPGEGPAVHRHDARPPAPPSAAPSLVVAANPLFAAGNAARARQLQPGHHQQHPQGQYAEPPEYGPSAGGYPFPSYQLQLQQEQLPPAQLYPPSLPLPVPEPGLVVRNPRFSGVPGSGADGAAMAPLYPGHQTGPALLAQPPLPQLLPVVASRAGVLVAGARSMPQQLQQHPPQQAAQPPRYASAPFAVHFGRQLQEVDLVAGLATLRRAARTDRARRLADHAGFFRGAPWLLAPAIDAVQQPELPPQWRQILDLLVAMEAAEDGDSTSESEAERHLQRNVRNLATSSSSGGSIGDPNDNYYGSAVDDGGTSDARSVTPQSVDSEAEEELATPASAPTGGVPGG